jgi:hypothetical protein
MALCSRVQSVFVCTRYSNTSSLSRRQRLFSASSARDGCITSPKVCYSMSDHQSQAPSTHNTPLRACSRRRSGLIVIFFSVLVFAMDDTEALWWKKRISCKHLESVCCLGELLNHCASADYAWMRPLSLGDSRLKTRTMARNVAIARIKGSRAATTKPYRPEGPHRRVLMDSRWVSRSFKYSPAHASERDESRKTQNPVGGMVRHPWHF